VKPPKNTHASDVASENSGTQIQAQFQQVLSHLDNEQFEQAQALCQEILRAVPDDFKCLLVSGFIAMQYGSYHKAVELFDMAIRVKPELAEAYFNRGIALQNLGQLTETIASFERAIALKPDYFEAYFNRGNVHRALGQQEAALADYDRAIALKADFAEAYTHRGHVLRSLNRLDTALASYDRAIVLRPGDAEAYYYRGNACKDLNRLDAALASYDRAVALKPDFADAYTNRGLVLQELKRPDAALASFDQAIVLRPDFAEAYSNRGIVLHELGRLKEAEDSFNQAIRLKPDYAEAYSNRGLALQTLGRLKEAEDNFNQAIRLKPDYAEAYSNRGIALQAQGQLTDAMASFDQAIGLKSDLAEAYWNKSLALLLAGDFAHGWELYEWRWEQDNSKSLKRDFRQPLWSGAESLEGKTILLHSEQGLGDAIQFCRYAALVADLGARVILGVSPPLLGLLRGLAGVAELIGRGEPLPDFDYHCPLLSLPLAFNTDLESIPTPHRYLHTEPEIVSQWEARLGEKSAPRVGLVWSGSSTHKDDHNRSIPLSQLLQHLPDGFEYVSLQKDVRDSDKAVLESGAKLLHFGDDLNDFTDTAALCELMDVVISVDTSVAHLSGALERPTWVLLPFSPDWRWLLDRDDSPWYASMKLYRQAMPGDWDGVLARVRADLAMMPAV